MKRVGFDGSIHNRPGGGKDRVLDDLRCPEGEAHALCAYRRIAKLASFHAHAALAGHPVAWRLLTTASAHARLRPWVQLRETRLDG